MSQESLKNKTVKGVGWSAMDNVASYAVSFVVGIVLARLLSPDDYGLIGIITIFTTVCTAVIFLCSPLIAKFFGKQKLAALTRVSSFTLIVKPIAIMDDKEHCEV